jgi:enediyne biosynthesis protein E4
MSFTINRLRFVCAVCGAALLLLAEPVCGQVVTFSQQQATLLNNANYTAQSASLADVDNDGDLDIMFQATVGARLFKNTLSTGVFDFGTAITMSGTTEAWSAAWGDYDSNGYVDVFVGQENNSSPTTVGDVLANSVGAFTNTSEAVGLADPGFHQSVAWADIDSDSDLDLLIAMEGPSELHEVYRQNADHTFTPVGAAAGFQAPEGIKAYGMAIGDTDGDGDLDVYISTCRSSNSIRNNFFENQLAQTNTLSFIDIAGNYTGDVEDGNGTQYAENTYSAEFHDFDDDGDLDLFVVGADTNPSKIYRNDGANQFTDVDQITGHPLLSTTGGDFNGGRAVDYDNDGDLDLFFHDHLVGITGFGRRLFENKGNWEFVDVTGDAGETVGLDTQGNQGGYDSAWGDLDNDGDLDLVAATNGSWNERVFISDATSNGNHWLHVNLNGTMGNLTGIGTAIYATIDIGTEEEQTLRRDANSNAGAFNQNDIPVHFGLGDATVIDQLRIHWPDGTEQYLFDVPVDQYLTISYAGVQPGDFNRDGVVDAADFVLWRKGQGNLYTQRDFALWQGYYGQAPAGGGGQSGNVPEPASGLLCLLAACAIWSRVAHRLGQPLRG